MVPDDEILDVNRRYHDVAASTYDSKWGIDFGPVGQGQVLGKFSKVLGEKPGPYARALEIGAGTGYITLNLLQTGVIEQGTCTDVSAGMIDSLRENARRLGLEVQTAVAPATALPFRDESFDLVCGHAVIHHLPDLDAAFAEFARVLAPGGMIAFAGEPSAEGDRIAALPKRAGLALAPLWRRAIGASERVAEVEDVHDHALEAVVDVHTFDPARLARPARAAGFVEVNVKGEELFANWFGWFNRTLEASADPASIPHSWLRYAYRGYLALQRVDEALLEPRLGASVFYNLMIAARKPV